MTETAARAAVPATAGRSYYWLLTLSWGSPEGTKTTTRAGTWTVRHGDTRASVCGELVSGVQSAAGTSGAVVLFFSLEPNDL